MLSSGRFLYLLKRMHVILSSPKWIDSLISTNHLHTFANFLFKTSLIFNIITLKVLKIFPIWIYILPNILRSKGKHTIKFHQLIECTRNVFLEKLYTKFGGEASPRPFSKKLKLKNISGSTVWIAVKFVFIVCPSQGLPKHIKSKVLITCF